MFPRAYVEKCVEIEVISDNSSSEVDGNDTFKSNLNNKDINENFDTAITDEVYLQHNLNETHKFRSTDSSQISIQQPFPSPVGFSFGPSRMKNNKLNRVYNYENT